MLNPVVVNSVWPNRCSNCPNTVLLRAGMSCCDVINKIQNTNGKVRHRADFLRGPLIKEYKFVLFAELNSKRFNDFYELSWL